MRLLDLIRGEKPPAAASLREALAQADADRAKAAAALDQLQASRRQMLLDGADDRRLDAVEADIVAATRQLDRLDLATIQGQERLQAAEEAERRAQLDRVFDESEAKLQTGVRLISKEWPPLAHKLRALALELERLQAEIDAANQELLRAGDPRAVGELDRAARPSPPDQPLRGAELWRVLRLPSTIDPAKMFYPHVDAWGSPLPEAQRPDR